MAAGCFDFLGWSAGQSAEWRGIVTLLALKTLSAHGRAGALGGSGGRPAAAQAQRSG